MNQEDRISWLKDKLEELEQWTQKPFLKKRKEIVKNQTGNVGQHEEKKKNSLYPRYRWMRKIPSQWHKDIGEIFNNIINVTNIPEPLKIKEWDGHRDPRSTQNTTFTRRGKKRKISMAYHY